MRSLKLILLGAPGAGKGTQAEIISGKYNIPAISTGAIIREAIQSGTEMGKNAKSYIDAGALVPDEVVIGIIRERLAKEDCVNGFILDGFPRTIPQAQAMLEAGIVPSMIVEFILDDTIILERLCNRVVCTSCNTSYNLVGAKRPKVDGICDKCSGNLVRRKDDNEDIVLKRFEVYRTQTHPCLSVFESAIIPVYTIDNSDSENAQKQFEELMATL